MHLCGRDICRQLIPVVKHYCTGGSGTHVCIVGSGPAGFYTAQQLLKSNPTLRVDIYERSPVPFGLVRYGVAPDHPEVKTVINSFTQTARNERCSFIGNVTVGKDVTLPELQQAYSAVVLSYGADSDRRLCIPGEDLQNVLSARAFVGWYSGLPTDKDLQVNMDVETAVVLGHGNVALDVARILLTSVDHLKKTDISQHALDALSRSRIKTVHLVGRRGPLQVAFTIKELREMIKLPECRPVFNPNDFKDLVTVIETFQRPRKRLSDLMYKTAMEPKEKDLKIWSDAKREWYLKFLRSPLEFCANSKIGSVESIKFAINKLEGPDLLSQKAVSTDDIEEIHCGLVLKSIGYKSVSLDVTLPFDDDKGVILNENGRVKDKQGLYCSGWVSQGPAGVILTTMGNAFETGKLVLQDLKTGILDMAKPGKSEILELLRKRGTQTVDFIAWEKIDKIETENGKAIGKPREKITSIQEMLKISAAY